MKVLITWAVVFISTAVVLGAIGAHALEKVLNESQLASFETGVRYQMYHGIALLALGLGASSFTNPSLFRLSWKLLVAGVLLFSGSIYLLNLRFVLHVPQMAGWLGPVTPIGGLIMISGWIVLLFALRKNPAS